MTDNAADTCVSARAQVEAKIEQKYDELEESANATIEAGHERLTSVVSDDFVQEAVEDVKVSWPDNKNYN